MTAWGVVCGMRATIEEAGIADGFTDVRVAVQGAGHVGGDVVRHLLAAGARVTVADIYSDRIAPLAALGAETADPKTVHAVECDVYAPCALGAAIRPDTVEQLRCRVVAGAANNQLLDGAMGDALHARGILYAPDFVINAGGVINISEELGQPYDADRARTSVERIGETLRTVFARAKADGVPTHVAADRIAEERIAEERAADPDPLSALRPAG
jgi:leucine dehydrogenase